MFAGRHIPIRVYVAGLFVILTLAIGFSMAGLFYSRMRAAIASTSAVLFDRTASEVAENLSAQRAQIAVSLGFAAQSGLAEAHSTAARMHYVDTLRQELTASSWVVAAYVGYPNGDFIELRRRPIGRTAFGVLGPAVRYILFSVERGPGGAPGRHIIFYGAAMRVLSQRDDRGFRFDPRTRPWYGVASAEPTVTSPYLFFATPRIGVTMSSRARSGSVFGADIDLANASQQLVSLRPTPSSKVAIASAGGELIAYSELAAFARDTADFTRDKTPLVGDLHEPALNNAFTASVPGAGSAAGTYRTADGRLWLFQASPVFPKVKPSRAVVLLAVPEDELFAAATRVRNEALLLSLALVILWVPLTVWVASFVARPLAALRAEAIALRSRDFGERETPPSVITEIVEFADTFSSMRQHIREHNEAATRFIPQEFLRLLERADILALELGDHVEREMTILFSDIRSFTALSESMSPQQTFNFVNSYLTRVGPIIRDHRGFIDKYIGDAIMGLFPQRAVDALEAAIAMQRRVVVYNEERARAGYAPIAIGIGLHSGNLMLGTIGETLRFETTVIADAVNVAARLESLTKTFGSLILASGQVIEQVDAATYVTRRLGDVQVVGTTRAVTVIEICDADPPEKLAHKQRTAEMFEGARVAYATGDFVGAHRLFAEVVADDETDKAAAYFRDRATVMAAATLSAWDGVEKMESK